MKSLAQKKVQYLQNDCSLFSRLYISCQVRSGDLEEFFKHENQPFPPSLSNGGAMKTGTKSDIIEFLNIEPINPISKPLVDVVVLDGAAVVHMLKPGVCQTFEE